MAMFRRGGNKKEAAKSDRNLRSTAPNVSKARQNRSASVPNIPSLRSSVRVKGIIKHRTKEESLAATYGSTESENGKGGIKFHVIEIREYERTVGDNPSCSSGPPISIAWEYYPDSLKLPLEEYEGSRPPRRTNFEMILPRDVRQGMLRKEWGVTQSQIASAVRNNIKVKNQRRTTVNNLSKSTKVEEAMENATRKVMKGLFLKKSTDKEVEKLLEASKKTEEASAAEA